mgnify:CR=1 FL=1
MTITPQDCQCGQTLINSHGLKTKFLRINGDGTCNAKCKRCGEFTPVPLTYKPTQLPTATA